MIGGRVVLVISGFDINCEGTETHKLSETDIKLKLGSMSQPVITLADSRGNTFSYLMKFCS